MKDMKDISASAQEALEHARDKAFGKVKSGIQTHCKKLLGQISATKTRTSKSLK